MNAQTFLGVLEFEKCQFFRTNLYFWLKKVLSVCNILLQLGILWLNKIFCLYGEQLNT